MKKFQSIQVFRPKRNAFDLSHEKKLSCNMGDLIPFYVEEILPGDKFKVNTEIMMRLAPMLAPIMHRVNVYTHYFFVPNRIVWDNWEKFITGGEDGTDETVPPTVSPSSFWYQYFGKGSLADYMGLPLTDQTAEPVNYPRYNAMPFRAYTEIYNEYYRDQNLTPKIDFPKGDTTPDADQILTLRKRAWEKDYFTSCLPWSQRGGEVGIPVDFNYKVPSFAVSADDVAQAGDIQSDFVNGITAGGVPVSIQSLEEEGVSVSINELRKAARLQEWLEKNARAGARYTEQILSHFGVKSKDSRLQRPEFLGGGKHPVVISEVLNTTGEAGATEPVDYAPVGEMYGHGIAIGNNHGFSRSFTEHGFIIGIMSTIPRTAYNQGVERMWSKFTKFDYYWPEFAHLGEQEVLNRELYQDQTLPINPAGGSESAQATQTFGYQSRYSEYKFRQSSIAGDFRDSLKFWHMGREFDSQPALNESFIESDPTYRIFAVTDETVDHLYIQLYNRVRALRPMPYFGTPKL